MSTVSSKDVVVTMYTLKNWQIRQKYWGHPYVHLEALPGSSLGSRHHHGGLAASVVPAEHDRPWALQVFQQLHLFVTPEDDVPDVPKSSFPKILSVNVVRKSIRESIDSNAGTYYPLRHLTNLLLVVKDLCLEANVGRADDDGQESLVLLSGRLRGAKVQILEPLAGLQFLLGEHKLEELLLDLLLQMVSELLPVSDVGKAHDVDLLPRMSEIGIRTENILEQGIAPSELGVGAGKGLFQSLFRDLALLWVGFHFHLEECARVLVN